MLGSSDVEKLHELVERPVNGQCHSVMYHGVLWDDIHTQARPIKLEEIIEKLIDDLAK